MVFELKKEDYDAKIKMKQGYSLIDFKAKWCTPCKLQKPVLELLSVKMAGKLDFFTCDIDEEPELVNHFDIFSVPTMLLIKDGKVVSKIVGYKPASTLEEIIYKQISKNEITATA